MYIRLSHIVEAEAPSYPGEPSLVVVPRHQIRHGDDCNTFMLTMFNHFGTHIDAPKHFHDRGRAIAELPLSRLVYEAPLLVDLPKECGSLIEPDDIEPHEKKIKAADLLLIRTGMEKLRKSDPERYAAEGPAVSAAAARYMNATFVNLKAIGFDFISLGSPVNALHAAPAHQALLGMFSENYVCLIEDMALADAPGMLKRVFCMPLLVRGIDSAPVTVIAETDASYPAAGYADERPLCASVP